MSQTVSSSLLLISLLLESAALSSRRAASRFQFHFGAPPDRFRMNWGAPPERAAVKVKLQGVLRSMWSQRNSKKLHPSTKINLHTITPKSPTNERTNKHTNTQPIKQTSQHKNRQTSKLKKTRGRNHFLLFPIMVTMPWFNLELTCH